MAAPINPIMILAMHRSGSSVLSGCLQLLGIPTNTATAGAEPCLASGPHPSLIHDIFLRDLGCQWDMVGALPEGWQDSPAAISARRSLDRLLSAPAALDRLRAFADPRLCRLHPLWFGPLEERGFRPGVVVLVRHPLEVARSLAARDGLDLQNGLLLWLVHNREAFAACQGRPHVVLTYDQLVADPVAALGTVEKRLGLTYPRTLPQAASEILAYVRSDLKHQHAAGPGDTGERDVSHFTSLYERIRRFCVEMAAPLTSVHGAEAGLGSTLPAWMGDFSPAVEDETPAATNEARLRSFSARLFESILAHIGRQERLWRGHVLERERRILTASGQDESLCASVVFPAPGDRPAEAALSRTVLLAPGEWQEIVFPVPPSTEPRGLRPCLTPLNTRGIVSLSAVRLVNPVSGAVVFQLATPEELRRLEVAAQAFVLADQDALTLCVTGNRPVLVLPELDLPDCPLELRIWINACTDQDRLQACFAAKDQALAGLQAELAAQSATCHDQAVTLAEKDGALGQTRQQLADLGTALETANTETQTLRDQLAWQTGTLADKDQELAAQALNLEQLQQKMTDAALAAQAELQALQDKLDAQTEALAGKHQELAELWAELGPLRDKYNWQNQVMADKDQRLTEAWAELGPLRDKFNDATTTLATKGQELEALQQALAQALADTDRRLSEARTELDAWQGKCNDATAALAAKEQAFEALQQALATKEQAFEALQQAQAQALADTDRRLSEARTELDAWQDKCNDATATLADKEQEFEALQQAQAQTLADTDQRLSEARTELDAWQDKCNDATATLADKEQELEALRQAQAQTANGLAALEAELALQTTAREQLLAQQDDLAQLAGEYQAALAQADADQAGQVADLEARIAEQETQARQQAMDLIETRACLAQAQARTEHFRQAIAAQTRQVGQDILTVHAGSRDKIRKNATKLSFHLVPSGRTASRTAERKAIQRSGLFDPAWYAAFHSAHLAAGQDPLAHYLDRGAAMGLDPLPLFSTLDYLWENLGLIASGGNPLADYCTGHTARSRNPHPLFDTRWYLLGHPDVARDKRLPLAHYLAVGDAQGYQPHPLFDTRWYAERHPEVAAQGLSTLAHFVLNGLPAGEDPGPLFDSAWYAARYPEAAASGLPPLLYYLRFGRRAAHRPGPNFDPAWYLEQNPDVIAAGLDPLVHFVHYGMREGRPGSADAQ